MAKTAWKLMIGAGIVIVMTQSAGAAGRQVLICMESKNLVSGRNVYVAKAQASAIYEKIGVELKWARPSDCVDQGITIHIVAQAPKDAKLTALAHARPFDHGSQQQITVFWDRVVALVGPQQNWLAPVLGHVLAHEIGHVLLESDAHAETGLMAARWRVGEISTMGVHPLGFSPVHVTLIHLQLDKTTSLAGTR